MFLRVNINSASFASACRKPLDTMIAGLIFLILPVRCQKPETELVFSMLTCSSGCS